MINCTFENNYGVNYGGAALTNGILVIDSSLTFKNCNFKNNSAETAGSIYIATLGFKTTFQSCLFISNMALSLKDGGGCIFTEDFHIVFTNFCKFYSNSAKNMVVLDCFQRDFIMIIGLYLKIIRQNLEEL